MKRVALAFVLLLALAACSSDGEQPSTPAGPATVTIEDLVVGTGAAVVAGDVVTVHYTGRLTDGRTFDSSYTTNQPFTFRVGAAQAIAGWDQGVPGMRVGGKRRLTIPPSLGYGSTAQGPIPANSTLIFDVELLSIAGR